MSLVVFPYPGLAGYVQRRREPHQFSLWAGVLLAVAGGAGQLGLFGEWFRHRVAPASASAWLGVALAFGGAAGLRRATSSREAPEGRAPAAAASSVAEPTLSATSPAAPPA